MSSADAMAVHGRVAVVTGGAGGIGFAAARALAHGGADVALWDVSAEAADAAAQELLSTGRRTVGMAVDVGDPAAVDAALAQTRQQLGTPSLVVTAAGVMSVAPFLDLEVTAWERTMRINLTGSFCVVRACARAMVEERLSGSIVCVSSVAGRGPRADAADYAASKAGVISLVRSAAVALGSREITVNAVCPGVVDTDMTRRNAAARARGDHEAAAAHLQALLSRVALGRVIAPAELADVIAFLLSPAAAYITGQALNVDGGMEFD